MRKIQQKNFQSSVFQKLGTLKSSTRNPHIAGFDVSEHSAQLAALYVSMTKSSYSLLAKNCIKSLGWETPVCLEESMF
jgi:hypothetical protein